MITSKSSLFFWLAGFFFVQQERKSPDPAQGAAILGAFFSIINLFTIMRLAEVLAQKLMGYDGLSFSAYVIVCFVVIYPVGFLFDITLVKSKHVLLNEFSGEMRRRAKLHCLLFVIISFAGLMLSFVAVI